MSQPEAGIQNVSDTALWVAMYRAYETDRPDAHFRDPFARRLAGSRGEEIVRSMPQGRATAWAMIVRTAVIDELVMRLVREQGVDTVLNLAAGLDARPYRLDLPASCRWIDVDLPAILAHKREVLAGDTPKCRYESRAIDLRDADARRALFTEVAATSRLAAVLTEGLLIYLDPEQVASLARDLAASGPIQWWIADIGSPALVKRMQKQWGKRLEQGNAPFRFAPAEGTRFFEPHGWKEREYRSIWEESIRLKRQMPMAWLWQLLARFAPPERREAFRRFSGIVLLGR